MEQNIFFIAVLVSIFSKSNRIWMPISKASYLNSDAVPRAYLYPTLERRKCRYFCGALPFYIAMLCFSITVAEGQVLNVDNTTQTPVFGIGHDYIQDLSEIVNPANGSLSIRIKAPSPRDRAWNDPNYAYSYDSPGQFQLLPEWIQQTFGAFQTGPDYLGSVTIANGGNSGVYAPSGLEQLFGGWTSSGGYLSFQQSSQTSPACSGCAQSYACSYATNFVYTDSSKGLHPIYLLEILPINQVAGVTENCGVFNVQQIPTGGDGIYTGYLNSSTGDVYIRDNRGNVVAHDLGGNVEDTNGNYPDGTGRTYGSTYNKTTGLTTSMTVPGLGGSYTYQYPSLTGTNTASFNTNATLVSSTISSACPSSFINDFGYEYTGNEIVTIPDGKKFTITFDQATGFVNGITYPTGAYVTYKWNNNSGSDQVAFRELTRQSYSCGYQFDSHAIQTRIVSYDGSSNDLEQSFSYTTNWNASGSQPWKQTTVTTTDLKTTGHPSFQTIYTYIPGWEYAAPGDTSTEVETSPIPLESTIVYKGTSGETLKIVQKTWSSNVQMTGECTTVGNSTSGIFYQYAGTTNLVTDKAEYDFGLPSSGCQRPSAAATRETITTYQNFNNTPIYSYSSSILDRPCSVIVYGNGGKIAETDYLYDGGTTVCGAAGTPSVAAVSPGAINHDEANYGTQSTAPRGNVTSVVRKCLSGCADSTTQYSYDETGQVVAITDPKGHVTTYSYADAYDASDGSPSGNTNTYVSKITHPSTNGITHTETFTYGFEDGHMRSSTDVENSKTTNYCYYTGGCNGNALDPWGRLTGISYPDGGSITQGYSDAGPNPYTTATTAISGSITKATKTILDAYGHTIHTQLTSDPQGIDTVDTNYDGFGNVASVSNAYRSTSDSTYGLTSYAYDALGRKTLQCQPDNGTGANPCKAQNSYLQWCYNGVMNSGQSNCTSNKGTETSPLKLSNYPWVDYSDETGKHWQQISDGLGRLAAILEPDANNNSTIETDYQYDALNNLLRVDQWGGPNGSSGDRVRTFTYNGLSQLVVSSNPETSLICYGTWSGGSVGSGTCQNGYDLNGNLVVKTDTRGIAVNYAHDALNRLLSKTYSNDSSATTNSCYQYDQSPLSPPSGTTNPNWVGRMTNQWTQSVSAGACAAALPSTGVLTRQSILAYDPMGRVSSEQQCVLSNCTSGSTPYSLTHDYDLAGNPTLYTNGTGSIMLTNGYDGAGRLNGITSSWEITPTLPGALFSGTTYNAAGSLTNATYGTGLRLSRTYDNRLRITGETDKGAVVASPIPGSATIAVTGAEQHQ